MLFENNCYISVRSSPLIFWSFLVRSLARNFSRPIKCTSQIWKCALIGLHFFRSFREMFVREDCVTSQKNVCGGGYKACRHLITFFWSPFFCFRNIKGFRAAKWAIAFEIFSPLHRPSFFFLVGKKENTRKDKQENIEMVQGNNAVPYWRERRTPLYSGLCSMASVENHYQKLQFFYFLCPTICASLPFISFG